MTVTLPDLLGLVGSAVVVVAYLGNLQGRLRTDGATYSLMNLAGALLILISLWWAWNLPAAIVEVFWAATSIYGLTRAFIRHQRPR